MGRVQRTFRAVKLFYVKLLWWIQLNIHLSKLIEYTTARVDPNAKNEPWVVMICHWRSISCNKHTLWEGMLILGWGGVGGWAMYVCGEWARRNCAHFLANLAMNQKVLKK